MTLVNLLAILAAIGSCGWLGYRCAVDDLRSHWVQLDSEREAFEIQKRELEQIWRVRMVFLSARRAMQAEVQRHITHREAE